MQVDFTNETLFYPQEVKIYDKTTSNFSHPENFVVFECVARLLEKGYKPKDLELEPRWKLGRTAKGGKADILVRDKNQKAYIIIECKTAKDEKGGDEYEKELKNLFSDGGQLFSYYWQEQETKFLCLYTSDFDGSLTYKNKIISTTDDEVYINTNKIELSYKNAKNEKDCFEVWQKTYNQESSNNGIFDDEILPYEVYMKAKTFDDLNEFGGDSNSIYNKFATILRRHNISGKENAFDKLVNLFLCKIYDEFFNPKKLEFTYRSKVDTFEDLQDRLMQLYQKSMKEFLGENITFVSNEDVNSAFSGKISLGKLKNAVNDFIKKLKFYSNNDFAFLEVHNEELFYQNGLVLVDIVELFSEYKLTQNKTNQFLGNLFELFLQKGMKQDEGQFFTPMQICEFIIYSLPIDENYLKTKMPRVIDYACGAGHFLNTYANFIKNFISDKDELKEHYSRIYGIEKEYRLSKVAKVSSAMYGQKEINIAYFDALAGYEFSHPSDNKKSKVEIKNFDFDILIANPPYSVDGFLETLSENSKKTFEIYNELNLNEESQSGIESFFVERANQLLRDDAFSAIILPSSILTKDSVFEKAREIILQNFAIKAIVVLDSNTFGATGTNTIILFLQKYKTYQNDRTKSIKFADIISRINNENLGDSEIFIANYLNEYCEFMRYDSEEFKEFLKGNLTTNLQDNEIFKEYFDEFSKSSNLKTLRKSKIYKDSDFDEQNELEFKEFVAFCDEIEREKLLYFALTCDEQTLIIKREKGNKDKDNKLSKEFLGYEWSNRKGSEGIKELNSPYLSPLFERENPNNENKLNFLIKQSFYDEKFEIPSELEKYAFKSNLCDLIDFKKSKFDKVISLEKREMAQMEIDSKYPLVKLGDLINENQKSKIQVQMAKDNESGKFPFFTSGENVYKFDKYLIDGENIYLSTGGNAVVKFYNGKSSYSTDTYAIKSINENKILTFYLFVFLQSRVEYINKFLFKGMGLKHLQKNDFRNLKIPLPPIDIQKQIVDECQSVDNEILNLNNKIAEFQTEQNNLLKKAFENATDFISLGELGKISMCKRIYKDETSKNGEIPFYKIGTFGSKADTFITKAKFEEYKSKYPYPKKGDILISAAGTVGKFVIFDGFPAYFQDSNIVWVDNDEKRIYNKFLFVFYKTNPWQTTKGSTIERIYNDDLRNIKVPLLSLEVQEKIVAEFEKIENEISIRKEKLESLKGAYSEILDRYLK